jgi:hypothetical protein
MLIGNNARTLEQEAARIRREQQESERLEQKPTPPEVAGMASGFHHPVDDEFAGMAEAFRTKSDDEEKSDDQLDLSSLIS